MITDTQQVADVASDQANPHDQLDRAVGAAMRRVLTARYSESDALTFLTGLTSATLFGTTERKAQDRAYEMLSSRLIKAGAASE